MQKTKVLITLLIAFALAMSSVTTAKAGGPTGSWVSGIACQNLDTVNQAIVTLTFYREGSATEAIHYDSFINPGASKNWLTTSSVNMPGFPTNFIGSGVISSSTALSCNVNTQSTGTGTKTSPYRIGTNAGFNDQQTGPVMYVPQVMRNVSGWNSYIAVQNTSNADVTVSVTYYNSAGQQAAGSDLSVVKAQSTKVFYQNDTPNLPNGIYGAKVTATNPTTTNLAVTAALYQDGTSYSKAQMMTYNGFASGAQKLFIPRFVRKVAGNNSGFSVQNVGNSMTHVTVTFTFGTTNYTMEKDLEPNASWPVYALTPELNGVDSQPSSDYQGSVVIEAGAGGSIVANVNEENRDSTSGYRYGQGATYNATLDGQQSQTVFFAQFIKGAAGFYSGFQISNTTSTPGTCDIEYVAQPAINENDVPLPANGSIIRFSGSRTQTAMLNMVNGYNAAVKATCTVNVTGIVNASVPNKYGDSFTQTGGLNQ